MRIVGGEPISPEPPLETGPFHRLDRRIVAVRPGSPGYRHRRAWGIAVGIGKIRVEVRGVKGKGYIRSDGGSWKAIKGFDAADSYVPFKSVATVEDVTYVGPARIDGIEYHKVSIPKAVLMHPTTLPGLVKQERIDDSKLELVIDDEGRPRRGSWWLKARARVGASGQLQRVEYELDLRFSKVGDKLTIKRP